MVDDASQYHPFPHDTWLPARLVWSRQFGRMHLIRRSRLDASAPIDHPWGAELIPLGYATAEFSPVRRSDLILFVRRASRHFDQIPIDDEVRLRRIKRRFARPDLLAWIDAAGPKLVEPEFYFPFLVISVAAQIALREGRIYEVAFCSPEHLTMLRGFPRPLGVVTQKVPLTLQGMIVPPRMPPRYQTGLIDAVFTDPRQASNLRLLRHFGSPDSYKVFIMKEDVYHAWKAIDEKPAEPNELYQGILQFWGGRRIYLHYSCGHERVTRQNEQSHAIQP